MSALAQPANVDTLLSRLECVKAYGPGWRARCPSCGGKGGKLSVCSTDDGRILLHCFGGCDALTVVQAAGLTIADLFPERLTPQTPEEHRRARRLARESHWGAALDVLEFEARIVLIAARDIAADRPLSDNDRERLSTAVGRIEGARSVLRDQPIWRPKS